MARDQNTYAKRQRETLKRQKAEAKRERRRRVLVQTDVCETARIGYAVFLGSDATKSNKLRRRCP